MKAQMIILIVLCILLLGGFTMLFIQLNHLKKTRQNLIAAIKKERKLN